MPKVGSPAIAPDLTTADHVQELKKSGCTSNWHIKELGSLFRSF